MKTALELLALIAGEYTHESAELDSDPVTGNINFKRFGNGQFLIVDERYDMSHADSVGVHGLVGYDQVEDHFIWLRVLSNGAYDQGIGQLENQTITFNITKTRHEPLGDKALGGPGIKLRTKWMNISERGFDVSWERSKDDAPWEQIGKAHFKKQ